MRVKLSTNSLERQLNNIVQYSFGFLEGAESGKKIFFDNLGKGILFALNRYIDIEAKSNPEALHHVYEWYQTGSPSARLFDLRYSINNRGLNVTYNFKQSRSLSKDATEPFYNKAQIMESGVPVTITPKSGGALRFEVGGNEVFTKNPVTVMSPGGQEVAGSFQKIFNEFMTMYFAQSFLRASGIYDYISKPMIYKKNFAAGARTGKYAGKKAGYSWIVNAKIEVE